MLKETLFGQIWWVSVAAVQSGSAWFCRSRLIAGSIRKSALPPGSSAGPGAWSATMTR